MLSVGHTSLVTVYILIEIAINVCHGYVYESFNFTIDIWTICTSIKVDLALGYGTLGYGHICQVSVIHR